MALFQRRRLSSHAPALGLAFGLALSACGGGHPIAVVTTMDGAASPDAATTDPDASSSSDAPKPPQPEAGPACVPTAATEVCSGGVDDDCNGFTDCLDAQCEGQACSGTGVCMGGACVQPCAAGQTCGPPMLPPVQNLKVTVRGDTAIVDFADVDGALDYRIYTEPAASDWLIGASGEVGARNAIYRCAGDRPMFRREDDPAGHVDANLVGAVRGYTRKESEALLGYVYLTPGADRQAVYQVSNPSLNGGYSWEYEAPTSVEDNGADYVVGTAARDRLIAMGWRDDGVAFYAPTAGTRAIYRRGYVPDSDGTSVVLYYADGPEHDARAAEAAASIADSGMRFSVLDAPAPDAVALHRVLYLYNNAHDVLAAGEARYQRAMHQGNRPLTSLSWPGLTANTTLIVEALDAGCPFPGGYIGSSHEDATRLFDGTDPAGTPNMPTITLDEARLSTGEAFVNGQHETTNRPRPIARGRVVVSPQPQPAMDWFESFDVGAPWGPFETVIANGNNSYVYRNDHFSFEFESTTTNHTFGPVLGQLVVGADSPVQLAARGIDARIAAGTFLHVTMSADIPSTFRRYPQIWITTTPVVAASEVATSDLVPIAARLGPWPFQMLPPGTEHTIVVQPFGRTDELQIEFCDQRGWGVSQQCDRANIYGFHAGDYMETWASPWLPVPLMGELAGSDRLVKFDVYASTRRVYVFIEGRPAGCAELPAARMPEGPVTVVFGSAAYHIAIDESVVPAGSPNQYWQRYSIAHVERRFDDLGIAQAVPEPAWDETILPCGTRWFGGSK